MRNQGYYHVRRGIKWDIAYYTPHFGGAWVFAGSNEEWDDLNLDEIDERRITREEPIQQSRDFNNRMNEDFRNARNNGEMY